jgi:hypothetical protein
LTTPRTSISILGRTAVSLTLALGGTLITAAPAMAGAPMAVHGAYGDDPYGDDPGVDAAADPYETTTTTVAPTTTTTAAPAPAPAPVVEDPAVVGAGIGADPAVAVAPAEVPAEAAPLDLDTLPRTGNPARTQAMFALVLVGLGSVVRFATRKPAKVNA